MLQITKLDERHIADLVALSDSIGWDYAPPELRFLLSVGVMYGHVDEEGRAVSSAAVFPYTGLASIGGVMVDPKYRRLGLGTKVMNRVLEDKPGIPAMLVATAQGQLLYESMGFHTVGTLHKFLADTYVPVADVPLPDGYELTPLNPAELEWERLVQLDAEAIGAVRRRFLERRVQQAVDGLLLRRAGSVVGFALAVQGPVYRVIGPVVAPNAETALAMVDTLARRHDGALRIDIPSEQTELTRALPPRGFRLANVPPVMLIGAEHLPPRQGTLFAISAQAYG
ncbi:GNAT family N-acetyltransferase [Tumebacillus flagellatus]|uniref:N-acetyltransferase domain-containing protein n=1 Tax=Tumebacillus flagellatus TaxID=1157490 RepID=A0A074LQJ1_9BACL|nr:GNAT family N-acetyltransferase [Tumebacillus flagellatus]KEO82760.1 hypothetical protein EL26_13505 [Tumebacillus flagellatus]